MLKCVAIPLSGDLPDAGLNPCLLHLLHWRASSLPLVPPEKPNVCLLEVRNQEVRKILEVTQPHCRNKDSYIHFLFFFFLLFHTKTSSASWEV